MAKKPNKPRDPYILHILKRAKGAHGGNKTKKERKAVKIALRKESFCKFGDLHKLSYSVAAGWQVGGSAIPRVVGSSPTSTTKLYGPIDY